MQMNQSSARLAKSAIKISRSFLNSRNYEYGGPRNTNHGGFDIQQQKNATSSQISNYSPLTGRRFLQPSILKQRTGYLDFPSMIQARNKNFQLT